MLQKRILEILEGSRGELVTGGELARRLEVSRTAVWKAINSLREAGHDITAVPNRGYTLAYTSDGLSITEIQSALGTKLFGRSLELLDSVDSTNNYIKRLDIGALPEGHAVIADEQTGGRGRLGRSFVSSGRGGVYLSVLLKPQIAFGDVPFLTICAAVAVSRALEEVCGLEPGIKWVNDIFCGGKKICGILSEAAVSAELKTLDYAVVGMGVNTASVPAEIADIATSVYEQRGLRGVRNRLAAAMLRELESVYLEYCATGDKGKVLEQYNSRLFILGREVTVTEPSGSCSATVLSVSGTGGLIIRDENGLEREVVSGEIQLCY